MQELSKEELNVRRPVDKEPKWYVLHTRPGYENVAKENLITAIEKYNLQDRVFDIVIPMEDVVEEKKNGKREVVQKKRTPDYIYVKMKYGDDIWHQVVRTVGITGFAGPKGHPLDMPADEILRLRLEKPAITETNLVAGDIVEILEGALNGFSGTITDVDAVNAKVKVTVEMFGRETPVELQLDQVRKINN